MFDVGKVFSSFNTTPSYNGKFNGADGYIMQSQESTDKLIQDIVRLIHFGYNPNVIYEDVLRKNHIQESDLTDWDKARLKRAVEAAWEASQTRR